MCFYLGCAIWGYKDWVGELFPAGSRSVDFLRLYSRRFTTVEGNTTFYSTPDAATVKRWATETPDGFQFCLKLPRAVTHQGLLRPKVPEAIAFLQHMQGLGDRLGPLFVQLPPSYGPSQFDDLAAFLQAWPQQIAPLAVEVRHLGWFREPGQNRLNSLLQDLGMGRVLLDTRPIYDCPDDPQLASERRKPRVPLQPVVTAGFTLVRYISHPDAAMNQPWMAAWVPQVDEWLRQGIRVYLFVHCPVEARSPAHARSFQRQLEQHGAPVLPLPWDAIADAEPPPASQLTLF